MKISLINGSPRKNRSCNFLIDNAIEGIKAISEDFEIEKIQLTDYKITPCNGCDKCLRPPNDCPLADDDDIKKIEDFVLGSSAILIAAPNYFGSVSSQIKTLIDRSRPWKMANYKMKDILFAPIAASGLRSGGAEGVVASLINFALTQGMVVFGALGNAVIEQNIPITSLQKFGRKEFVKKDEIDELGQKIARNLGARAVELLKK